MGGIAEHTIAFGRTLSVVTVGSRVLIVVFCVRFWFAFGTAMRVGEPSRLSPIIASLACFIKHFVMSIVHLTRIVLAVSWYYNSLSLLYIPLPSCQCLCLYIHLFHSLFHQV